MRQIIFIEIFNIIKLKKLKDILMYKKEKKYNFLYNFCLYIFFSLINRDE